MRPLPATIGTCCIFIPKKGYESLPPTSLSVVGQLIRSIVVCNFRQVFKHAQESGAEIRYIVPNNCSMCAYDTTFHIGEEEIKPRVCEKAEAEQVYLEATDEGRAALLAENLGNGLVEFKLGNVPAGVEVAVDVKIAFVAQSKGLRELWFKFPLDVSTSSGSVCCVARLLKGPFSFELGVDGSKVESVSANVSGRYEGGVFRVDALPAETNALLVTVRRAEEQASCLLVSGGVGAVTLYASAGAGAGEVRNREFIFVVDCSGSMRGDRIARAGSCLELFLRSLPAEGTLFNVVRFGGSYELLFPSSVGYNEENVGKALALASSLEANLGGTELLGPLTEVMKGEVKEGGRQVFVLTDGQVMNTDAVLEAGRRNAGRVRCFTLGIGSGADAGLVTGLAQVTGGSVAFVTDGEDPAVKVLGQLSQSLKPSVYDMRVESEAGSLEVAPFPVPPVTCGEAVTFFVRAGEAFGEGGAVRVTGRVGADAVEYTLVAEEAGGAGAALLPLFAFETLQQGLVEKGKAVALSVESGILCRDTAFVGVSQKVYVERRAKGAAGGGMVRCCCCRAGAPMAGMRALGAAPRAPAGAMARNEVQAVGLTKACADGIDAAGYVFDCAAAVEGAAARGSASVQMKARERREVPEPGAAAGGAAAPAGFSLRGLLRLQSIDGSWASEAGVASAIGEGVPARWAGSEALSEAVFATVVAVAALRKKAAGDEGLWRMIAEKAMTWLRAQGVPNPEELIAQAEGALSSGA